MRLLDHLVWKHLLEERCQRDLSRCPERARQCAACPHRAAGRWATRLERLATTLSCSRLQRPLRELNLRHPLLAVLFGCLFGGLAATLFLAALACLAH
jgi:hypothetical protein